MKKRILFFVAMTVLVGCRGNIEEMTPQVSDVTQTVAAINNQVGTIAASTQTAIFEATLNAPTLTPAPEIGFGDFILAGSELNDLLDIWPEDPTRLDAAYYENLCIGECYSYEWRSLDGLSWIRIALYHFDNRELAFTRTSDFHNAQAGQEIALPEISALATDAWIFDRTETGEGYILHVREGKVFAVISLFMGHLDTNQNVLFLSLYGERQVEKIERLSPLAR